MPEGGGLVPQKGNYIGEAIKRKEGRNEDSEKSMNMSQGKKEMRASRSRQKARYFLGQCGGVR